MLNKITCGDCVKILNKIEDRTIDLVFNDPPWNLGKDYGGYWNDDMDINDYYEWCNIWIEKCFKKLKETGSFYLYIDPRYLGDIQRIMDNYGIWRNTIVWYHSYPNPTKKIYPKSWKAILFYTKTDNYKFNKLGDLASRKHTNPREKPSLGRPWDCWTDISKLVGGWPSQDEVILKKHTKQMYFKRQLPKELIRRIVLTSSNKGDLVLDCFSHSGTVAVVCKKLKRKFIAIEINPEFVEKSKKRLETGMKGHFIVQERIKNW